MNKRGPLIISFICTIIFSYGQDYKITDFRAPFTKKYGAILYGSGYNSIDDFDVGIHPYYFSSSDDMKNEIGCFLGFEYQGPDNNLGNMSIELRPNGTVSRYVGRSPFFFTVSSSFNIYRYRHWGGNHWSPWEVIHYWGDILCTIGAGRIRNGGSAIAALKVNETLKKWNIIDQDLAPETISEIAQVLAGGYYEVYRHEHPQKYLASIMEDIISRDPAYIGAIPIFVWLEIFDITNLLVNLNYINEDLGRWQRGFGSRISVTMEASDITGETTWWNPHVKFPLFKGAYHRPSLTLKYEYEKPLDIKRQFSLGATYTYNIADEDHIVGPYAGFGYGLTNRLLAIINASVEYNSNIPDHAPRDYLGIYPEVSFVYYLEDHCSIDVGFYLETILFENNATDDLDSETNGDVSIDFHWRIF